MRTFEATAHREGKWWVIEIPELDVVTQARTEDGAQFMATDAAALVLGLEFSQVKVNLTWQRSMEETLKDWEDRPPFYE